MTYALIGALVCLVCFVVWSIHDLIQAEKDHYYQK